MTGDGPAFGKTKDKPEQSNDSPAAKFQKEVIREMAGNDTAIPRADRSPNANIKLSNLDIQNDQERAEIASQYSDIKRYPKLIDSLSRNELEALLPMVLQDLGRNPYYPRGKIPGYLPPAGSSTSPFINPDHFWHPDPTQPNQQTMDLLAMHNRVSQQRQLQQNPFLDAAGIDKNNPFNLARLQNVDQRIKGQSPQEVIKGIQIATASSEQIQDYQKWLTFKDIQRKDPLGLSSDYMNALLNGSKSELTLPQLRTLTQQKDAQRTMQMAVQFTDRLNYLKSQYDDHHWIPDSLFYQKDNPKFLGHIKQNLPHCSTHDLLRAKNILRNESAPIGSESSPLRSLDYNVKTEIVKRMSNEISEHLGVQLDTNHFPKIMSTVGGQNPDLNQLANYLPMLLSELSLYSADVLKQSGIEKIVLCQNLSSQGVLDSGLATPDANTIYFDIDPNNRYDMRQTIHHEIFHMIDAKDDGFEDTVWENLNKPGFKYDPTITKKSGILNKTRLDGFFDKYGMSGVREDKAVTFAEMVVDPRISQLKGEKDSVLEAKLQRVKQLVTKFNPFFAERFFADATERRNEVQHLKGAWDDAYGAPQF